MACSEFGSGMAHRKSYIIAPGGLIPHQRTTRRLILALICGAALLALWGVSVGQRAQLKRRALSQSLALFD